MNVSSGNGSPNRTSERRLRDRFDAIRKRSEKKANDEANVARRATRSRGKKSASVSDPEPVLVWPPGRGAIHVMETDVDRLRPGEFLNDVIINFYLRYLQREVFSDTVREKVHFFNTFFYSRLRGPNGLQAVQNWDKSVDLLKKDFLVIPVNESAHWYLLIVCFPWMDPETIVREPLPQEEAAAADEEAKQNAALEEADTAVVQQTGGDDVLVLHSMDAGSPADLLGLSTGEHCADLKAPVSPELTGSTTKQRKHRLSLKRKPAAAASASRSHEQAADQPAIDKFLMGCANEPVAARRNNVKAQRRRSDWSRVLETASVPSDQQAALRRKLKSALDGGEKYPPLTRMQSATATRQDMDPQVISESEEEVEDLSTRATRQANASRQPVVYGPSEDPQAAMALVEGLQPQPYEAMSCGEKQVGGGQGARGKRKASSYSQEQDTLSDEQMENEFLEHGEGDHQHKMPRTASPSDQAEPGAGEQPTQSSATAGRCLPPDDGSGDEAGSTIWFGKDSSDVAEVPVSTGGRRPAGRKNKSPELVETRRRSSRLTKTPPINYARVEENGYEWGLGTRSGSDPLESVLR